MKIRCNTWDEMKSASTQHNLKMSYDSFDTYYFIYCNKGNTDWFYSMPKRTEDKEAEQVEFETGYLPLCVDWATKKESFLITCPANTITEEDVYFGKTIWLVAGSYRTITTSESIDKLDVYVFYYDELENEVKISDIIITENVYKDKIEGFKDPLGEYAYIPEGLYIKIKYENTDSTVATKLDFSFTYKDINA